MVARTLHPADRLALDRAITTRPVWNGFDTAANAIGVQNNVLLHAGPPIPEPKAVSRPILNSACVAAVFEGLAPDLDAAEAMILAGDCELRPAQDHDVVTPLAAVVSASMPLHAIYDGERGSIRVFAPINGGSRPSLRLGLKSGAVLEHIRWLNSRFRDILEDALAEGIDLVPLAVAGLRGGDDCHGRTPAATSALINELDERSIAGISDEDVREFMASSPSLFLNLWMAATRCIMKGAAGIAGSSFITAAGGNGVETGIQISALPGRWFTTPAAPPSGRFDVEIAADRALGAIGDSAVIEALGLGAMAIEYSPVQKQNLGPYLPPDAASRFDVLPAGPHPDFAGFGVRLGLTARAVVAASAGPVIGLGILDAEGREGRLGAGIYDMPAAPFVAAMKALEG